MEMWEAFYRASYNQQMIGFATVFIVVLLILIGIWFIFSKRRTKVYRREIADIYVAAKIREIAKDEHLDLVEEYNLFLEWVKKRRLESKNLNYDDIIEEELSERVGKKLDKEKKGVK